MRNMFDAHFTDEQREAIRKTIWDKHEKTTTTTQPVLRRHGKLLLLSLLLVPAGLRLFGAYPDSLPDEFEGFWNMACGVAFTAPLLLAIALFYLKEMAPLRASNWLFGTSSQKELDELKISSVFFQRIEGSVDHKWITNPADSIQQFRDAFAEICRAVLGQKRRLVVVVDNLDRLDRDEARAFWATMQAFFDRTGWGKEDAMARVSLVVPFSMAAVSQIFKTEGATSSEAAARAFVDKSFDLAFYVPPPIQVDSRGYLLRQIQRAFPDHEAVVHENVRNLYDHHRTASAVIGRAGDTSTTRRTPREMKLFVNQLVALYRAQGDGIHLETMAAYLLTRDSIEKDGIDPSAQLSKYQRSLLPSEVDAVQQLAAVHFGVSIPDAAQVILSDPIREALSTESSERLEELAARSGFVDVLESVVSTTGTTTVEGLLTKVLLIHNLSIGSRPELHATWTQLIEEFRTVGTLGDVSPHLIEGITALRSRAYPSESQRLLENIRAGLSSTWVSEAAVGDGPDDEDMDDFDARLSQADSWVTILGQAISEDAKRKMSIPPFGAFSLRVLDALSQRPNADALLQSLTLEADLTKKPAATLFVSWPGDRFGPTNAIAFCKALASLTDPKADWSTVAAGYAKNLASSRETAAAALEMLVSMAVSLKATPATTSLKQAIETGAVGTALTTIGSDDVSSQAFALVALLLVAPDNTPTIISRRGNAQDEALVALLDASTLDDSVIERAAKLMSDFGSGSTMLSNLSTRPSLHGVGRNIFYSMLATGYAFASSKNLIIAARAFLQTIEDDYLDTYFESLTGGVQILSDISKRPVTESTAFLADRIYRTTYGRKSVALRNKMIKYLAAGTLDRWKEDITNSGLLFRMAHDIQRLSARATIGVAGLDALVELVRSANSVRISAKQIALVAQLLDSDLAANLPARLWSAILAIGDPAQRKSAIRAAGDLLMDMTGTDTRTVADVVLMPLVVGADQDTTDWMTRLVLANAEAFEAEPSMVAELRARTNVALRASPAPSTEVKRSLRALAQALPKKPAGRRKPARRTKGRP